MTSELGPIQRSDSPTERVEARSVSWLPLSGMLFGILQLLGWFLSGGDSPDYMATNEDWIDWAASNRSRSGIGAFLTLLAGFAFLHYAGTIRDLLGTAEIRVRGTPQLARAAFAGAITGTVGLTMAIVIIGAATAVGADAEPLVTRAVTTASAGPYLVAAMGFATLLGASGLLTLRTGVFSRWTGVVALTGAVAFLVTFMTLLAGTGEDSVFGYGFLPGILALVIWAMATSVETYRTLNHSKPR